MAYLVRHRLLWIGLILAQCGNDSRAQETAVLRATHTASAESDTQQSPGQLVRFAQIPTVIGDRVVQRIGTELELHTVIKQAGQISHDSQASIRRRQEREVEVLEVVDGRARRARVTYHLSREMSPGNPNPAEELAQPVEGKSYLIARAEEQLLVTDLEGAIPPRAEYELVLSSMENFGNPSALAELLLSRPLQVGERLEVPRELAVEMMGMQQFGVVQRFDLELQSLRKVEDRDCAVFAARIATQGKPDNPLRVRAQGEVVIEIATTRTIQATLRGPMTLATLEQGVQHTATGDLLLAVESKYHTTAP